jgi:hypothetical protein
LASNMPWDKIRNGVTTALGMSMRDTIPIVSSSGSRRRFIIIMVMMCDDTPMGKDEIVQRILQSKTIRGHSHQVIATREAPRDSLPVVKLPTLELMMKAIIICTMIDPTQEMNNIILNTMIDGGSSRQPTIRERGIEVVAGLITMIGPTEETMIDITRDIMSMRKTTIMKDRGLLEADRPHPLEW